MRVRVRPCDDRCCGWYAMLPPPSPARPLTGPQNADWVVLGAGFTGLAAARRIAEHHPEARVLLLEAQRVGFGASGRNSGFVVDIAHFEERLGPEGNLRLARIARRGIGRIRDIVEERGIDCAWAERGALHGAVGDAGLRCLEGFCRGLEAMGEPYRLLDKPAIAAITGTTHYRSAAQLPGTASVQPAALARGLAAALPANVELFEESPVRALHRGEAIRLECPDGEVRTSRLLLACNGFTPSLGFLRRRVFPMRTFGSLTRPLRDDELAALGGEPEWGLVPEERIGTTVRRTRDGRILIRNSVGYGLGLRNGEAQRRAIREIHLESFRTRFPALRQVEFEYTWAGVMGLSMNNAQSFGRISPGVFAAAGYNGVGVAMGSASGELLADLAVGSESELLDDIQALPHPAWIPPDPLLRIGAGLTVAYHRARARTEL